VKILLQEAIYISKTMSISAMIILDATYQRREKATAEFKHFSPIGSTNTFD
jgi:hypothetical protein